MATQLDIPAATAVLKQKYAESVPLLSYKRNPALGLCEKNTDFGGKNKSFPVRSSTPQGRGPTLAGAQGNKTASLYNAFILTRKTDYATATITGETIMAADGDDDSLIDALVKEIDGAIHTSMRNLALCMYRNGGGARGQIASTTTLASTTLQLANVADVTNWDYGMTFCTAQDDGYNNNGTLLGLNGGGFTTITVIGVDSDLGKLTTNVNISTIGGTTNSGVNDPTATNTTNGSYLFQTAAGVGSDYASMVSGFGAWLPFTAPTSTDFFYGVNRSSSTRLSGNRITGGGQAYEDTLIDAATRIVREGGEPTHCFMNPLDWAKLVKALGAKVIYDRAESVDNPEVGFRSVELMGPDGPIKVIHDLNCPAGFAYMGDLSVLSIESAGNVPMILDLDGNTILRNPTADSYDIRIGYYANMVVHAPSWWASIVF